MTTTSTPITCKVRCNIGGGKRLIGCQIFVAGRENPIDFDWNNVQHVPAAMSARIREGEERDGNAEFTVAELVELADLRARTHVVTGGGAFRSRRW